MMLTVLSKADGSLTKRISYIDGNVVADGSECVMTKGTARRVHAPTAQDLAAVIEQLGGNEALAFGQLRDDLPDEVPILASAKVNGCSFDEIGAIARTKDNFIYLPGQPAWVLLDVDVKGLPEGIQQRVRDLGGIWQALASVVPELDRAERVTRTSTSSGLRLDDKKVSGVGGYHISVAIKDGADTERFLKTLHARLWLAGLGWGAIGGAGQFLERSLIDRSVGSPERLIFEAGPIVEPPLRQEPRRPTAISGEALDTLSACPPLTEAEEARFAVLRADEARRLDPEMLKARTAFIARQAQRIVERDGIDVKEAERIAERQLHGELLPGIELEFDSRALAGMTVRDVLADPDRFVSETLADPLEGIAYGRGKAKIMLRADGSLWINSFAHGRTIYELCPQPEAPTDAPAPSASPGFPELDEAALYGLTGEVVRTISPHSEADPAAILVQYLAAVGNALGRQAYYQVEGDRHPPNLFVTLVGESAKGRKGTSWGRVRQIMAVADPPWAEQRIVSGLSSGEGVIWAVRDPIIGYEKQGKGAAAERVAVETDPGVSDKRLLVVESEYSRALTVMQRDGNTLSAVTRDAWDRGTLASLTKNSPAKATDAHISIIGHITTDELRACLDRVSMANGSANRVLWIMVRRARELPFGGNLSEEDVVHLGRRTGAMIAAAANVHRVPMAPETKEMWRLVYGELSAGRPGLLGAITNRAEAQVIRLSLIYALLDNSGEIRPDHLRAALAVWSYAEESAEYIWGKTLGDPIADEILRVLRPAGDAGKTRTELSNHFGRNQLSAAIGRALERLASTGHAQCKERRTGGRPVEVWLAVGGA